jgi:hypothetical protein
MRAGCIYGLYRNVLSGLHTNKTVLQRNCMHACVGLCNFFDTMPQPRAASIYMLQPRGHRLARSDARCYQVQHVLWFSMHFSVLGYCIWSPFICSWWCCIKDKACASLCIIAHHCASLCKRQPTIIRHGATRHLCRTFVEGRRSFNSSPSIH